MEASSNLRDFDCSHIISGLQPPRGDLGISNAQSNQISSSLLRRPCLSPKTPGVVRCLMVVVHINILFLRVESNLQLSDWNGPSPKDAYDAVSDFFIDSPLLDSN